MVRNLLLIAFRSLKKNKFFSVLNIVGLALGMAVFLLIGLYVTFERSYEDFIPGRENIYRVTLESRLNNELVGATAENYPAVGPAMQNELPGVISYARLYNMGYKNNVIMTYRDAQPEPLAFKQRRFLYADSAFLPMMGYPMVKGDGRTALAQPFSAVISEKLAGQYFKEANPIGKVLHMQDDDRNNELVTITGVFKDLPPNTHLKFDVLFSYKTLYARGEWGPARYDHSWDRYDMYTFVQLSPGTDPKTIEAKLPAVVLKHKPDLRQGTQKEIMSLQPLKDIHLKSELAEEADSNGNERIVVFMSLIGLFVLFIAWINYVNLSTARAVERAKEVGVRKVVGAFKRQLISQFLVEAALVNLLAVLIAFLLVAFTLPYFNTLSGLSLTRLYLYQPWFLLTLLLLWVAGTCLSGIYPAMILSSFKPVVVLKGKLKSSGKGIVLRRGLVVVQFVASIVLITGTIIIYRQLNYMMDRDLGMNIDQVMVMDRPSITGTKRDQVISSIHLFRDEVKRIPSVSGITASFTVPGKQREYKVMIKTKGVANSDSVIVRFNSMDYDFMDVYKMKLLAGSMFSRDRIVDSIANTVTLVTESTCRLMGYKQPQDIIGRQIVIPSWDNDTYTIIGVVNDYHQLSLKKTADPGLFFFDQYGAELFSIRFQAQHAARTIEDVRKAWVKAFPGNPFDYFFLDEYFNQQYKNERKFGTLFTTFAILAIVIGCLGLFGLSAYTASQRIKEIGIRKVLGASVTDITTMLSKDFLKLIVAAIVIALPLAWFVMNSWLQDFAYRTSMSWWIFVAAGAIALVIAMLTVSLQAVKAAITNPVKNLRTE
jgi:putative ABC transport system permease protein